MKEFDPTHRHLSAETEREARGLDHRYKVGLLVMSVATLLALIGAALMENYLAPWRLIQLDYAGLLREEATDDWGRKLAEDFQPGLSQIVVPELGAMDRCVSCHNGYDDPRMVDAPQPHTTHPGEYLGWHEDSRYGCTVCHRGQGAATTFEDAKAEDRHWEYPLLPAGLTQSSCGVCHTAAEVAGRGGELYAAGQALFEAKGCRGCHTLDGRGGSLGPRLDGEGLKVKGELPMVHVEGPHTLPQWLMEHFDDPARIVEGSQMPDPGLSRRETRALTAYMLSLQDRDLPSSYLSPQKHLQRYRLAHPERATGEELYATYCQVCHDSGEFGRYDKFFGHFVPAVRSEDYRAQAPAAYVAANIREGRPGTLMPAWGPRAGGLSEEEIARITAYLLGREPDAEELAATPPSARGPAAGDAQRGATIFARQCSGCHGPAGNGQLGPSLANATVQQWATDEFLWQTIAHGRRDTAMPAFLQPEGGGLADDDIEDLVAFIRGLGGANAPGAGVAAVGGAASDGAAAADGSAASGNAGSQH